MKEIKSGMKACAETRVSKENLAVTVGSGSLEVFATPMMTALMEKAAAAAVSECMENDETTVGTMLDITHVSATPEGMNVKAYAEVTEVNGREITFKVSAEDEAGLIGEGTHKRFVVFSEKFINKAKSKNIL
ncbi:thioesterase family protein [Porcipelethomonas sp.]|uniref:thioesterase family protein n=1 Tax=Porcipelethomonas sp. TaxID=2981675 RepID=UPI003EFA95FE